MADYDVIVIGLGGMGSAAAYHLARGGWRVLGLDAHPRGHALGASHGRSRIFRTAYTRPAYVPLVRRAEALWRELEAASGRSLLTLTGMLLAGWPGTPMIDGPIASAREHGLPYELLSATEVGRRFPGFHLPESHVAVHEPRAGFLRPEACVGAHLDLAAGLGATLRHAEPVRSWAIDGAGVRVITDAAVERAERLVVTAGPWMGELLAGLDLPLTVVRVVNIHVDPIEPALYGPESCPVFGVEGPEGHYYGVPALPGDGLKIGKDPVGGVCTPATVERTVSAGEIADFQAMLTRYLPGAAGPVKWAFTCLYTNTPDRHFIVDRHPAYPQVVMAGGCSGHGFKFTTVIGEILADLTETGSTDQPIDHFRVGRF